MANNKISGSYLIQTAQYVSSYILTGQTRSGKAEETVIIDSNWLDMSNGSLNDRYLDFQTKNKLHITAVKITAKGGDGLRPSPSKNAGIFQLVFKGADNTKFYGPIFEIGKFNEWQETDDIIEPFKHKLKGDKYGISFSYPEFNIDDYNIQSAYVGKPVFFIVEMKIKTAGIILDDKII